MQPVEIKPDIYWIGVNDRKTRLFEGLWDIQESGVSYNSYLINDKKKALIDLSSADSTGTFLNQIASITEPASLDYIIINHMEPDHSGALVALMSIAPHASILGTKRAEKMLKAFYGIKENVQVVKDGDTLSLGKYTLSFTTTPRVHWPETMMTYLPDEQLLFSGDGFGAYGTLDGYLFDDEIPDLESYRKEALRYYANILTAFSDPINKALEKLAGLSLAMIAPAHGIIWRSDPQKVIDWYRLWASYAEQPGEEAVTLVYGTMYGNTERMMEAISQGVIDAGLPLQIFNISSVHPSHILPSLYTRQGVIIGAPTYERKLFPPIADLLNLCRLKEIQHKKSAYFGSYAWGGGAAEEFTKQAGALQWQIIDQLDFAGGPSPEKLIQGRALGKALASSIITR